MRLATRTGLASFVAASITLLAVGSLFRGTSPPFCKSALTAS